MQATDTIVNMTAEYRQHLVQTYEELSLGYAKTLVTLAGGALGLSLTFAKDIVGDSAGDCRWLLILAWALWAVALSAVLVGFFCGRQAARFAMDQYDQGRLEGENAETAGGAWTSATHVGGLVSLVSFVVGLIAFVVYVALSLE